MKTIILDTNVLLQDKVDVLSQLRNICDFSYEAAILDKTLDELKNKKGEPYAKALLTKTHIKTILTNTSSTYVDAIILDRAPKEKWAVVTQDKALKTSLVKAGVLVITIRQQKTLMIVNPHVL